MVLLAAGLLSTGSARKAAAMQPNARSSEGISRDARP
jgi:hypothetical protein